LGTLLELNLKWVQMAQNTHASQVNCD